MSTEKVCWSCKKKQPIDNFSRNRSKRSGRSAECKVCVATYNKRHVAANAEYYRVYRKAKRKDKLAWYLFLECRTRAKVKGLPFDLAPDDIVIPPRCPVFGFEMAPHDGGKSNRDRSPSIDRIDSSLGYVRGNIQVVSYLANRMKTNATPAELIQFAEWILSTVTHGSSQGAPTSRLDPPESQRTHSHQHDRQSFDETYTWGGGYGPHPGYRRLGPIAQGFA